MLNPDPVGPPVFPNGDLEFANLSIMSQVKLNYVKKQATNSFEFIFKCKPGTCKVSG